MTDADVTGPRVLVVAGAARRTARSWLFATQQRWRRVLAADPPTGADAARPQAKSEGRVDVLLAAVTLARRPAVADETGQVSPPSRRGAGVDRRERAADHADPPGASNGAQGRKRESDGQAVDLINAEIGERGTSTCRTRPDRNRPDHQNAGGVGIEEVYEGRHLCRADSPAAGGTVALPRDRMCTRRRRRAQAGQRNQWLRQTSPVEVVPAEGRDRTRAAGRLEPARGAQRVRFCRWVGPDPGPLRKPRRPRRGVRKDPEGPVRVRTVSARSSARSATSESRTPKASSRDRESRCGYQSRYVGVARALADLFPAWEVTGDAPHVHARQRTSRDRPWRRFRLP